MPHSYFDLAQRVHHGMPPEDFWSASLGALEHLGVSSVCYGVVPFLSEVKHRGLTSSGIYRSTHSQEWLETFGAETALDNDLSCEMILANNQFTLWHDESVWVDASDEQKEQAQIENDLGLEVGVSIPLCNGGPDMVAAGIGLNMPDVGKRDFDAYWAEVQAEIFQICTLLDTGMRQNPSELILNLTPREKDVLTYFAIGLQREEVAFKLGIKAKTVDHFSKSARDKLNASTTAHAVAKALALRLITP